MELMYINKNSKVLREELYGRLESTLLSSPDEWIGQVSTNSETVRAAFEVLSLIQCRGSFATTKNFICQLLRTDRELRVDFARINQERNASFLDFLSRQTR